MGYVVKHLKGKRLWKVQYRTYVGGQSAKDIRDDDYFRLGLNSKMCIEETIERVAQLNSQEKLKRLEEKRIGIKTRLKEEDTILNAFLPDKLRQEFENMFIDDSTKKISHWRTAKKLIVEVKLDCGDWAFYKNKWYKLFESRGYSSDYVQKLILILNRWGKFVAYKQRIYFESIPTPVGVEKQRIIDGYEAGGVTKASELLTPDMITAKASQLKSEQINWLLISVWFGLRPKEIDNLSLKTMKLEKGIFWVYQSKLSGISKDNRWKPIPIKYPEQVRLLAAINSHKFKRPLNKTLKKVFQCQLTCYGGRKGFTDLMLQKGNSLESISQWLGHKSIDRTWKVYKSKKIVLMD